MSEGRLQGQIAWISGGASGMGQATAELFAAEGASVVLADIQADRGEEVAKGIEEAGGRARYQNCDVAQEAEVKRSISKTIEAFGGLHILVNCAGIVHVGPLHEYKDEDWDHLMGVNLKSIYFSLKHGIEFLRQNDRSYMVNIGSVGSYIGQAQTPAYTTSKHAVLGLSRSIALDYAADGLRCNCVCPGITDTPMLRYHLSKTGDADAALAERLRRVPTGVALYPEDIARSILYLCCEDSAGITGTSLVVDGGYTTAAEWETGGRTRFMEGQ
jgi:NAD(P)-dependent dehydrogenase (short-subunit alcohol dehydrogenase family)